MARVPAARLFAVPAAAAFLLAGLGCAERVSGSEASPDSDIAWPEWLKDSPNGEISKDFPQSPKLTAALTKGSEPEPKDALPSRVGWRSRSAIAAAMTLTPNIKHNPMPALRLPVLPDFDMDFLKPSAFERIDSNGDGVLSKEEFVKMKPADTYEKGHTDWYDNNFFGTMFSQADIDDDDVLSAAEFHFAAFLIEDDRGRLFYGAETEPAAKAMLDGVETMTTKLRREHGGKVPLDAAQAAFKKLALPRGVAVSDDAPALIRSLFFYADVIKDGTLNLNELDFFDFLVKEELVKFTERHKSGRVIRGDQELLKETGRGLKKEAPMTKPELQEVESYLRHSLNKAGVDAGSAQQQEVPVILRLLLAPPR